MSVIIRLQNLPWSANALDIRGFFRGLSILDGGVNIVGGEMGDAFIAFSTDEDARQALMMTGGKIKEVGVQLFLSSRAEMQKVIETARQSTVAFGQTAVAPAAPVVPVTTIVAAPVIETPTIVAAPAMVTNQSVGALSNLLTQQMLQQKLQQQEQEKLQKQLEQQLLEHKKALLQQQIEKQGGFNMELGKSILMGEHITQHLTLQQQQQLLQQRFQQQGQDKQMMPKDSLRSSMDKTEKSGILGDRDRRRSRSRDRTRRRRDRSRSRDRRDRRRRRTNSRENSRERSSKEGDRERIRDRNRDDKDLPKPATQEVFVSGIWDVPPNIPIAPQSLANQTTMESTAPTSSLSPGERTNLLKLSEKRDLNAFQGGNSWNNPGYSTNISNRSSKSDSGLCVRISGMDLITGYGEIRRFFQGLAINSSGIKMINDPNGKRIGEACIEFIRPENRRFALNRDGNMLKDRKVHVVAITQEEFDKEIDSFRPMFTNRGRNNQDNMDLEDDTSRDKIQSDEERPTRCIKITNLPSYATQQDIIKMYTNFSIDEIILVQENSRVLTGYVRFFRSNDTMMAFNMPPGSLLYRNLEVTLCEEDKFSRMMMYHAGGIPRPEREKRDEDTHQYNRGHFGRQHNTDDRYDNQRYDNQRDRYDNSRDRRHYESDRKSYERDEDYDDQSNRGRQFRSRGRSRFDNDARMQEKHYETQAIDDDDDDKKEDDVVHKEESKESAYNPEEDIVDSTRVNLANSVDDSGEGDLHVDEDNGEMYEENDDDVTQAEVDVSMDIVSQESNEDFSLRKQEDPRLSRGTLNDSIQLSFNQSSLDPRLHRGAPENRDPRVSKKKSDCVVIANLEPKITDRDVVDFFSDVGLIPLRVHMLLNTQGQPSGDCFVEFISPDDAEKALTKNHQHLGHNTVTVDPIAREKVEQILKSFDEPSPAFEVDSPDEMSPPAPVPLFGMRGGNFGMQPPPMMRMRGPFPPRPMGPGGPPPGMGPPFGARPPFGMRMNGNGMMNGMAKGCIVAIENLPYRATYDDILEFFADFDLAPSDIMRRFNDKGQSTGDARIRFVNPAEAMRAVEMRHKIRMMGRPVYLSLLDN